MMHVKKWRTGGNLGTTRCASVLRLEEYNQRFPHREIVLLTRIQFCLKFHNSKLTMSCARYRLVRAVPLSVRRQLGAKGEQS